MKNENKRFVRNLQITQMYTDKASNRERFRPTGNPAWKPPRSKCYQARTALTDILVEDINDLIFKNKPKHNISKLERKTILNLRNDKSIIIKRADKGGCIVILDSHCYASKVNDMLSDTTTYTKTSVDLHKSKNKLIQL